MTQEEKQLLLKILCAMLPYGIKCQIDYDNEEDADYGTGKKENNSAGSLGYNQAL